VSHLQWPAGAWAPRLRPRSIPLLYYMLQVSVYFTLSVINNKAFAFRVSMPLHMIFRSASLVANMFLGLLLLGKRYLSPANSANVATPQRCSGRETGSECGVGESAAIVCTSTSRC
jgi:hypothetical protein